jgi:hypothetical protein
MKPESNKVVLGKLGVNKLTPNKYWFAMLAVMSGAVILAIAFLIDAIKLGKKAIFGVKQIVSYVLGSGMILAAGALLIARQRNWVSKITLFKAIRISAGTTEVVAPSSVRSVLISVSGTVILVLVFNFAALWYLDRCSINPSAKTVSQKWEILQNMQAPVEWLVLGDSSCNQGVVPETLESYLGGTTINLCTIAPMTMLNDALMLDAYIEKFGPPLNVLIVHTFDILSVELNYLIFAKVPIPWGISKKYRFSPELISIEDQVKVSLVRHFPLYFDNRSIKESIYNFLRFPSSLFREEYRVHLTQKGYMPIFEPWLKGVEAELKIELERLNQADFLVTDISRVAVDRIITLAEQYSINVYIANSPVYEAFYENPLFQNYFAKIQEWWRDVDKQSDYITYIPSVITFPLNQMQELFHVIHSAAEIYTEKIALKIITVLHNEGVGKINGSVTRNRE